MKDQSLKQFGEQVRRVRMERNISQEQLAELAGVHRTYIGGVERGERNVGVLNIISIAKALNVSPAKFFESTE